MSCSNTSCSGSIELISAAIYGSLSIGLYIYLIIIIYRKTVFHHPFFYQFCLLAVSNIVLWLTIFILQRLIPYKGLCTFLFPRFQNGSLLLKALIILYYLPVALQIFTIILISINRMSVILSPVAATQFWCRHSLHSLLLVILVSIAFSFYIYDWGAKIDFSQSTDYLSLSFVEGWPYIPLALMGAIISVLCLIVIISTGVIGSFILYKSNITKVRSAEANLFWTNVGLSITTGVLSFYMVMIYVFYYFLQDGEMSLLMITIRGWLFDVNSLVPAWLLFLTNKQIQQSIFNKSIINPSSVSAVSRIV